jgi:TRAP-type C4-dicarboxylate transport system substrate-binding protein
MVSKGAALAVATALVVAAMACGGTGEDKAGGQRHEDGTPVVLTLEQHDPGYSGAQFADAVAERSGVSIRIAVRDEPQASVDFERKIVDDVRAGDVDLGVVAVRVLDTLGVTSFSGLIAPFLVDNLELQRRVLESPLAPRMLTGVEGAGVVGVAVLPGPLRRAFGYRRSLVGPEDYRGAKIGVRPGRVEELTFRSLGADTRVYLSLWGASREGAALNLRDIAVYSGRTVATNVVFWPRAETVIMNRKAFAALTEEQRAILVAAGREAVGPRIAEIDRVEQDALRSICDRKLASLVTASPKQIAELRAAVRPVHAELERDTATHELIAEIKLLKAGVVEDAPLRCPETKASAASGLEGRWQASASSAELLAAGASKDEARTYRGSGTLELSDGRWVFRGDHSTVTGTYTTEGDVARLTMETCTANPCSPGATTDYEWSAYRGRLVLKRFPGRNAWLALIVHPWTRLD